MRQLMVIRENSHYQDNFVSSHTSLWSGGGIHKPVKSSQTSIVKLAAGRDGNNDIERSSIIFVRGHIQLREWLLLCSRVDYSTTTASDVMNHQKPLHVQCAFLFSEATSSPSPRSRSLLLLLRGEAEEVQNLDRQLVKTVNCCYMVNLRSDD